MKIYVLRHGQTDWNAKHLFQGRADECGLNKDGITQASKARDEIRDLVFDAIISSPLKRAQQTAKIVSEGRKEKYILDQRLAERSYGDFEGKDYSVCPSYDVLWDYKIKDTSRLGNVEPVEEVFNRVGELIEDLKRQFPDGTVLLVCHGGIFKAVHYYINGFDEETDLLGFHVGNCQIGQYDY